MPEEQSFGVLVQIMHKYGLRDMFRYMQDIWPFSSMVFCRVVDLHHFDADPDPWIRNPHRKKRIPIRIQLLVHDFCEFNFPVTFS